MNGKKFCEEVLKEEIEGLTRRKVVSVKPTKDWERAKEVMEYPRTGKATVIFDNGEEVRVWWAIEISVDYEKKWEFFIEFEHLEITFKNGEEISKLNGNIWDALGINRERYKKIEAELLSAYITEDTKTGVIDRILPMLVDDVERRAFEVILLAHISEQFPAKILSQMGLMGTAVTLGDLKSMLKGTPDCGNPDCPVHGGHEDEKKTTKMKHKDDPMVR